MDQNAVEFLTYGGVALCGLSLIAAFLYYINRKLEHRSQTRMAVKASNRIAYRTALNESSTVPQLPPLPTYDEVILVDECEEMRYKKPCELNAATLEFMVKLEMPPPAYQSTFVRNK